MRQLRAEHKLEEQNFELGFFDVWFSLSFSVLAFEGEPDLEVIFEQRPDLKILVIGLTGDRISVEETDLEPAVLLRLEQECEQRARNWVEQNKHRLDFSPVGEEGL